MGTTAVLVLEFKQGSFSPSERRTKLPTVGQQAGKKKKIKAADWPTEKRISVPWENMGELQKILDGKMGRLRKTCKSQTEANNNVQSVNRESEKSPGGVGWSLRALRAVKERPMRNQSSMKMNDLLANIGGSKTGGYCCICRESYTLHLSSVGCGV